ncbi:MAG: DNA-binding protein [Spirochaetes bacterium]|nr:MAG: DNA-binding protein [Spirochaetota bacterium]
MHEKDDLLRPVEVAVKLKISSRTLANYRRIGRIKFYQLSQRTFRYHPLDVELFIESTRQESQLSLF